MMPFNPARYDLNWGDELIVDAVKKKNKVVEMGNKVVKILYVLDWLVQSSGITKVVMNYFLNIDSERVRIDFLTLSRKSDDVIKRIILNKGSNYYCLPVFEEKNKIWHYLKRFFEEHQGEYKIIHSHIYQLDCILFYLAKKYGGVKVTISHSHARNWADYNLKALRNRIMAFPIPYCADVWAACSMDAGIFLFGSQFENSFKKLLIHNAIDIRDYYYRPKIRNEIRKKLGYADEIVLGNIGKVCKVKNQKFLLDILKELCSKTEKYKLLIVGDGDLKEELMCYANKIGIQNHVCFTGFRSDIPNLLQAMDVFLFPSLYEGLGIAGIEAQASGLPCLFSDQIPKEAAIGEVKFLPVNHGKDVWVQEIEKIQLRRSWNVDEIISAGYDIEHESAILTHKYLNIINGDFNLDKI